MGPQLRWISFDGLSKAVEAFLPGTDVTRMGLALQEDDPGGWSPGDSCMAGGWQEKPSPAGGLGCSELPGALASADAGACASLGSGGTAVPLPALWCGRTAVSHSVKERTISENSLIILLQGLQGQVTTMDLRDKIVARGRIDNVDAFMNIRLANVTYMDRWGHQVELEDLFVTGRNVRYVHVPDDVNITATIEQQLQVIHWVRNFGSKGQGRREFPSKKYK
nr:U7 snRNA-associated Sm-like protein LSm10 [Nyctereutes procyonoides]